MASKQTMRKAAMLTAAIVLAACDSGDKIGSTIKGERIAVIEAAKTLQPDTSLSSTKPQLPRMPLNLSWPQNGYDGDHTMPYAQMSPHPHIVWTQSIGAGSDSDFKLLAHPVVEHGAVYTMDAQGLIMSVDAKTGNENWELDTTPPDSDEKAIGGGVAVDGGTLYAATGFGDVFAVNAKTGAVKWHKSFLKPLRAAPTIADNRVYVVSIDNDLNALDANSGETLWHHAGITEAATLMGASSPAAQNDNVIVAYNSGEIFDLRAQNGRPTWNYSLATATQVGALPAIADIRGLPVVDHGRVYAISHSGRMAAIDATSGDRAWEVDIGGIDTPVVVGDTVFVYGGETQLIAIARDSGRVMWVKQLAKIADPDDKDSDRIVWAGPVLAGERLWMVNSLGQLSSFSPNDGTPIDSIDLGGSVYLSPIIADRTMYVLRDDGTLIALK